MEIPKELKDYYNFKYCISCGIEYIGGTNSLRCPKCSRKTQEELIEKRMGNKRYMLKGKLPTRCFFCGGEKDLEVHHVDADSSNNQLKNLLVICIRCHRKLHSRIYNKIYSPEIRKTIRLWQKEHQKK